MTSVRQLGQLLAPMLAGALLLLAPAEAPAKSNRDLFGMMAVARPDAAGFERMGRLGVTTCRLQLNWGAVEDSLGLGLRDWSHFDRLVIDATAAGVRVLPLLHGVPPFISKRPSTPPLGSQYQRDKWRSFVSEAVNRYGPGGTFWLLHPELPYVPVTAWQAWNEPNVPVFFGGKVNVARYRDLLRLTAKAIRAADPTATVVTAGIFRFAVDGGLSMRVFLRRFYALKDVRQWFDVLALDPYSRRPRGVVAAVRVARRIMQRARDGRTPVWVTEVGWTTGGVGWRENHFRATPRQQARRLRHTYRLLRKHRGLRIQRAFWHNFQDFDDPSGPDPWMTRMGLLTLRGGRKPAWYAYARVAGGEP